MFLPGVSVYPSVCPHDNFLTECPIVTKFGTRPKNVKGKRKFEDGRHDVISTCRNSAKTSKLVKIGKNRVIHGFPLIFHPKFNGDNIFAKFRHFIHVEIRKKCRNYQKSCNTWICTVFITKI